MSRSSEPSSRSSRTPPARAWKSPLAVQGHVDATGSLAGREVLSDGSLSLRFVAPPDVLRYVVYKGSIAVDGVSLTVAGVDASSFSMAIIPHTQSVTTLGLRQVGEQVNLETDVIARYIERLLPDSQSPSGKSN